MNIKNAIIISVSKHKTTDHELTVLSGSPEFGIVDDTSSTGVQRLAVDVKVCPAEWLPFRQGQGDLSKEFLALAVHVLQGLETDG